ncbi:SIS domain-containing protein [Agromyces badenianii]|uniref:SIS domain-containing protein n=1 Tax=Agromyces badenianii TaxID=2080742 RepID=A0A2S0WUA3_9MICO|nr:SIS domain-containing protein [Agromyces badenianii]AWB94909.1 SIS domain-containing protein [Agromyces badenianii]PWC02960.1 MurR/RpiR family transcriptional regulator [Agromyces badenianii]
MATGAPGSPHEGYDARVQRRSAQLLKRRVVEQERERYLAALDWARDDGSFERIAALIVASRRRFILGTAKSFTYASLLAIELSAGLANVSLIDGTIVRPLDVLSDVRSTDVLVAISLSRYRKYTVDIARRFAEAGGTVIVITDSPDAPLSSVAQERLIVNTESASFANSPTTVALVIHLLVTLTTASAKGAGRRLQERDRLSESLDLYYD